MLCRNRGGSASSRRASASCSSRRPRPACRRWPGASGGVGRGGGRRRDRHGGARPAVGRPRWPARLAALLDHPESPGPVRPPPAARRVVAELTYDGAGPATGRRARRPCEAGGRWPSPTPRPTPTCRGPHRPPRVAAIIRASWVGTGRLLGQRRRRRGRPAHVRRRRASACPSLLFFVGIGVVRLGLRRRRGPQPHRPDRHGRPLLPGRERPPPGAAVAARLLRRSRSWSGWSPPRSTRSPRWPSACSPRCTGWPCAGCGRRATAPSRPGRPTRVAARGARRPRARARQATNGERQDQRQHQGQDDDQGQGRSRSTPPKATILRIEVETRSRTGGRAREPGGPAGPRPGSGIVGGHGRAGARADHDQRLGRRVLRARWSTSSPTPNGPATSSRPPWSSGDDEGRAVVVEFRAAAMGRCTTYRLKYDYTGAPDRLAWELLSGDLERELDGCYLLRPRPTPPASTDVVYELAVDLIVPIPGFVKRRAEARIIKTALSELKAGSRVRPAPGAATTCPTRSAARCASSSSPARAASARPRWPPPRRWRARTPGSARWSSRPIRPTRWPTASASSWAARPRRIAKRL